MTRRPQGAKGLQRLLHCRAGEIDQSPQRVMHLVDVGMACNKLAGVRYPDGDHRLNGKGSIAKQLRTWNGFAVAKMASPAQMEVNTSGYRSWLQPFRLRYQGGQSGTVALEVAIDTAAKHPEPPRTLDDAIELLTRLATRIDSTS